MMKVGMRILSVVVLSALLSGAVLAAPSLDITKGPVAPVPSNTGPQIDPDAKLGQWFLNETTGNAEVRTHEFYDNVLAAGPASPAPKGGASGRLAIYGFVSNIVYDTSGINIVAFDIYATITNDLPDQETWLPGDNSHGETLQTPDQYVGDMFSTKLTAEFAVPPWPVSLLPGNVGVYRDFQPHIVAQNHDQLGWYCWTPDNTNPDKVPWGNYYVPTWDFGDIPLGTQATRVLMFTVDGAGLDPADPRHLVIEQSYNYDYDVLLNRTTSLKISTWQDDLALDHGVAYPHLQESPPLRSSNSSVFHNIGEVPPPVEGGLSLPVTKPPLQPLRLAWTGPQQDPDAILGQWFLDITDGSEEARSHEYYDPVEMPNGPAKAGGRPAKSAASAIYGYATNVQYDAQQNIVAFDIEATITNLTPWPYGWTEDGNSHNEWTDTRTQYEGTLYDTKLTAEFAVDILTGLGGLPPAGIVYPPYRDTTPHICAENHDQLGWYCWTPDNPNPDKVPWGNYYVPTWDFGDIPPSTATSRTLKFTVDMGGLPPGDPRYAVIQDSAANLTDLLLNRTTSLKISTWIDDLAPDTGVPYPHMVDQTPLRSSDSSVFHNTRPSIPDVGGLSLDVQKPEVLPLRDAWTGPLVDPDSINGQWFFNLETGVEDFRTNEFYDPSAEFWQGLFVGSQAIFGRAINVQYDPASGNIVAFDIDATITNLTPWPYDWADGDNSHGESLATRLQYEGTMYDTKLTAEFAIDLNAPRPVNISPYRNTGAAIIRAVNADQLGWYCWTPHNPDYSLAPWGQYSVPTWDFGDIPQGGSANRLLSFFVENLGMPPGDPRFTVIQDSETNGTDILLNRTTSLKISTWIDELAADSGVPYPHLIEDPPLRSSDVSVFHNIEPRIPIAVTLDWDWVYQNAPLTLGWVHKSILTIAIGPDPLGNTIYSSTVTANPASTGVVQIVATANPLVWEIYGGQHGVDPQGMVQLDVTVYGMDVGGQGKAIDNIKVRLLGDIDDNGGAAPGDVSMLIMKLNGTPPPGIPDPRAFDLDANGGAAPGDVSILINILNGIPMP